jgi:transcriptional regulator with XRE-family HTH domain
MALDIGLADAVRAAVKKSGLKLWQVAIRSGIDASVISRFMRNERDVTLATAEKLLQALGCRVSLSEPLTAALAGLGDKK